MFKTFLILFFIIGIMQPAMAKACGYQNVVVVDNFKDLDKALKVAQKADKLCLIEVKCSIGARDNLGRPNITPLKNKENFIEYVKTL